MRSLSGGVRNELEELTRIYEHNGVGADDARALGTTLARYPQAYKKAMVSKELAIPTLTSETVQLANALTIGGSYLVGSILGGYVLGTLLPYIFEY